jgi:hypothetical protein
MKKSILLGLIVVALLCIAGWTGYGQKTARSTVTYEYRVIYDPTETGGMDDGLQKLNDLGAARWELVGISHERNVEAAKLYFRRIKN